MKREDRHASTCQEVDEEAICCSINSKRNGFTSFSLNALKVIERTLTGEAGRKTYVIDRATGGKGHEYKGTSFEGWCLALTKVENGNGVMYQRAREARKRRSALSFWSMGGPFTAGYIDSQIERINLTETVELDELNRALGDTNDKIIRLEQNAKKLDAFRSEVFQNERESQQRWKVYTKSIQG